MQSSQIVREIVDLFRSLAAIPHPSGQEEALAHALNRLLLSMGGTVELDSVWNLRCDLPASPGLEGVPLVCLQGHLDMVCARAPHSDYQPERDGIHVRIDHGWLTSDGRSSLGADNLLADCAILWLMGQNFRHGPVRLLFTTREEQALGGAKAMDPHWLDGVHYFINTDGFRGDRIIIGSAGGCRQVWQRKIASRPDPRSACRVSLTGFPGGHSGDDIGKGRVNPLRLLAQALADADAEIASLTGGTALNAIPSSASAVVAGERSRLQAALAQVQALGGQATLEPLSGPVALWSLIDRQAVLDFLLSLPHGVLAWLPDFPQIPACSANLGKVVWEGDTLTVYQFLRGSPQAALDRAARGCSILADRCGFNLAREITYPPWHNRTEHDSLARRMAALWERRNGIPIQVAPVHVGLEPSWLLREHPEISAVVIGTTILNAHSVRERACLESLPRFVHLLQDTLESIATERSAQPC